MSVDFYPVSNPLAENCYCGEPLNNGDPAVAHSYIPSDLPEHSFPESSEEDYIYESSNERRLEISREWEGSPQVIERIEHTFHLACIRKWVNIGTENCPICRSPVNFHSLFSKMDMVKDILKAGKTILRYKSPAFMAFVGSAAAIALMEAGDLALVGAALAGTLGKTIEARDPFLIPRTIKDVAMSTLSRFWYVMSSETAARIWNHFREYGWQAVIEKKPLLEMMFLTLLWGQVSMVNELVNEEELVPFSVIPLINAAGPVLQIGTDIPALRRNWSGFTRMISSAGIEGAAAITGEIQRNFEEAQQRIATLKMVGTTVMTTLKTAALTAVRGVAANLAMRDPMLLLMQSNLVRTRWQIQGMVAAYHGATWGTCVFSLTRAPIISVLTGGILGAVRYLKGPLG